jgi:hypothetical protein
MTDAPQGLAMPALDDLAAINMLNVILERTLAGVPAKVRIHPMTGVYVNVCRLTDKALREYQAARADLLGYLSSSGATPQYVLLAIDHLENCIDATYRAVLNAEALRANNIGLGVPRLTTTQRECLKAVRDAVEHSDDRLLQRTNPTSRPWFQQGQSFSLAVSNTRVDIGKHRLTHKQLAAAITKCCRTIEKIRGVPTGQPATAGSTSAGSTFMSDYFKQLLRASITQA